MLEEESMDKDPVIEFKEVNKIYGDNVAVKHINLKIMAGEFVCLIGTSGSGKTTILRMINRMLKPMGKFLSKGKKFLILTLFNSDARLVMLFKISVSCHI